VPGYLPKLAGDAGERNKRNRCFWRAGLSVCTLATLQVNNNNQNVLDIDKVKKPITAYSETIILGKLALEFFNVSTKMWVFSELWINDIFDLLVEFWANLWGHYT